MFGMFFSGHSVDYLHLILSLNRIDMWTYFIDLWKHIRGPSQKFWVSTY